MLNRLRKWQRVLLLLAVLMPLSFCVLSILFPLRVLPEYSTVVLDDKGEVIHAFLTSDEKWRLKTELHEVSPLLRKTILHKEDKHFYHHPGINPLAMLRALFMNVIRGKRTSGASTITMQVARMLEPRKRTYSSKVIEVFRAFQLEWKYSKDEILQLYLNKAPFGSNIEGVKSASVLYFKKNPNHLSLAEITALSIIPNRPSSLKIGERNDLIVTERNKWLSRFLQDHLFQKSVIDDALSEPLNARRTFAPKLAPHFAYKLKSKCKEEIIPTFLQSQMQQKVEKLVSDYVTQLRLLHIHNAAVVVVDNHTQAVVSYVGSANFYDNKDAGQVNGAAAIRQPGSALKPLIYGLCFDQGILTPKTVVTDVPININGYSPENFDEKFNGYVTVEFALENSLNIPAVKALHELGTDVLADKLVTCGFNQVKLDKKKLGLSMALGGCGVSLEEMTGLYAVFAHQGNYMPLKWIKSSGTSTSTKNIISPSASYMVTEVLSKTTRPDLPAGWSGSAHTPRIAWKTGTSYGRRDAWSIGYNQNYTVGIWVGNFSGQGVQELNGAAIATPLLFKIFNTIDYNSPAQWCPMPKECGIRLVCTSTGQVPNHFCTSTAMDYFLPLVSSAKLCEHLVEVAVSADEKISYCKNCQPAAGYKQKWYPNLSAEMLRYLEESHTVFLKIPPHHPQCEKVFSGNAPQIVFPVNGTEYLISKNKPEPLQLKCNTTSDIKEVYWYINDKLYQKASVSATVFFTPQAGINKISCTDAKGRTTHITMQVKYVDF